MARKPKPPLELACRAMCRFKGLPEDTKFEGRPMWESFIPEARAVLDAARIEMKLDEVDWKIKPEPRPSRILRYQMQTVGPVLVLRIETTAPGDLADDLGEVHYVDLVLKPEQAIQWSRHLHQAGEMLNPKSSMQ